MKIVVLGAGTVGTWIADLLCQHRHSVNVVDIDAEQTRRVNDELDVRAIRGQASHASVLFQAEVIGADVCLAVTGDDETNIVAASMAKAMGAERAMARVYSQVFRDLSTFDYQQHFGIDRVLSLEHLSAVDLARHIRSPDAVIVESFARGAVEVQDVLITPNAKVIQKPLQQLKLPRGVRIGSIFREGAMWIAGADDRIQPGDHVTLIGARKRVDAVLDWFRVGSISRKTVVIAGGGETGYHLARILQGDRFSVILMEHSRARSEELARRLPQVTVIQANATRRSVLEEERVGAAHVFVACMGDDEENIMAGVTAREIGTDRILAMVGRPDYADLVGHLGIDAAVSPRDVMARQVLCFLQPGPILARMSLPGGDISVFEIQIVPGAPAADHVLASLPLPPQCLIAALERADFTMVPAADDRLRVGDTIVALIPDHHLDEALQQFTPR